MCASVRSVCLSECLPLSLSLSISLSLGRGKTRQSPATRAQAFFACLPGAVHAECRCFHTGLAFRLLLKHESVQPLRDVFEYARHLLRKRAQNRWHRRHRFQPISEGVSMSVREKQLENDKPWFKLFKQPFGNKSFIIDIRSRCVILALRRNI